MNLTQKLEDEGQTRMCNTRAELQVLHLLRSGEGCLKSSLKLLRAHGCLHRRSRVICNCRCIPMRI